MLLTIPGLTTDKLDDRGQQFVRAFGATQPGGRVSVFAPYAAAASEVLLDAIARSDGTRASITRALTKSRLPDSVLGPLELDRNGEPLTHPITVARAERGGGRQDDAFSIDGATPIEVISPEARLVGAPPE